MGVMNSEEWIDSLKFLFQKETRTIIQSSKIFGLASERLAFTPKYVLHYNHYNHWMHVEKFGKSDNFWKCDDDDDDEYEDHLAQWSLREFIFYLDRTNSGYVQISYINENRIVVRLFRDTMEKSMKLVSRGSLTQLRCQNEWFWLCREELMQTIDVMDDG